MLITVVLQELHTWHQPEPGKKEASKETKQASVCLSAVGICVHANAFLLCTGTPTYESLLPRVGAGCTQPIPPTLTASAEVLWTQLGWLARVTSLILLLYSKEAGVYCVQTHRLFAYSRPDTQPLRKRLVSKVLKA